MRHAQCLSPTIPSALCLFVVVIGGVGGSSSCPETLCPRPTREGRGGEEREEGEVKNTEITLLLWANTFHTYSPRRGGAVAKAIAVVAVAIVITS